MNFQNIIMKKRNGIELSDKEINFFINGYTNNQIPDYQVSALLMAIYFKGLNERETISLTKEMLNSGETVDLSGIKGIKVDKHSTGGVGDTTSMIVGPIVASCGVPVAKMSGRGLGHTGGTIDKLESIPGFRVELSKDEFINQVKYHKLALIGQTGNLAPADKKLYALRDVTATVENISLIASSIMSKKLAAGSDAIVLDVKFGHGAFMKTLDEAVALAEIMVKIGKGMGRKLIALVTDMQQPLGYAIGNSLEVKEALQVLRGDGPSDLKDLCLCLAAEMISFGLEINLTLAREKAEENLYNGKALEKFIDFVSAQGGDVEYLNNPAKLPLAAKTVSVKAMESGYVTSINALDLGISAMRLGAGRETKESKLDYAAGILLKAKTGDYVKKGQELAIMHLPASMDYDDGVKSKVLESFTIDREKPDLSLKMIYARVSEDSTDYY